MGTAYTNMGTQIWVKREGDTVVGTMRKVEM